MGEKLHQQSYGCNYIFIHLLISVDLCQQIGAWCMNKIHCDEWKEIYTGLILGLRPANESRRYLQRRLSLAGCKPSLSPVNT